MNKGGSLRDLSRSLPPFRLQLPIYGLLLSAAEVRVNSRLCNQVLMPAFLHDASVIDHEKLIGMAHGLESVRDHDDRLIARQRLDRLMPPILIFGIDVCRRLAQYDDRRVFQHRAGNGNALSFAADERVKFISKLLGCFCVYKRKFIFSGYTVIKNLYLNGIVFPNCYLRRKRA